MKLRRTTGDGLTELLISETGSVLTTWINPETSLEVFGAAGCGSNWGDQNLPAVKERGSRTLKTTPTASSAAILDPARTLIQYPRLAPVSGCQRSEGPAAEPRRSLRAATHPGAMLQGRRDRQMLKVSLPGLSVSLSVCRPNRNRKSRK